MARTLSIRGASKIDPKKIYIAEYQPLVGAPTYVYGVFGRTTVKTGPVTGKTLLQLGRKLAREKYSAHYTIDYSENRSSSPREREIDEQFAKENERNVQRVHDRAMKGLNVFYRNSLTDDYGSEWDYQPNGGSVGNSP